MDIYLKVTATPSDGEPFNRGDLEQAVQATLHEVYPVDGGMPVVPEVEVVDWVDRIRAQFEGTPPITFVELEDLYGTEVALVIAEMLNSDRDSRDPRYVPSQEEITA